MAYKTKFEDQHKPNCERRKYTIHAHSLERPSSRIVYFHCPYCNIEIKAYVWSLCGGGKRCECGAIFGSKGVGYKLQEPGQENSDAQHVEEASSHHAGSVSQPQVSPEGEDPERRGM